MADLGDFIGGIPGFIGGLLGGPAGALIGTGAGFLGNWFLQERQNQQNVDLWKQQMMYNDPAAQRARLKAAGMNPALVYGHGSVANTISSPPRMERANINESIGNYQQIRNMQAQYENILAQNEVIKAQAQGIKIDNAQKARELSIYEETDKTGYRVGQKGELPGTKTVVRLIDIAKKIVEETRKVLPYDAKGYLPFEREGSWLYKKLSEIGGKK